MNLLERKVRALERQLAGLRNGGTEVIVLRTLTDKQAKAEIKDIFARGGVWYYSDIARELGLGLEQVVEICNGLLEAGEIMIGADDTIRKG